jgi:hypothetical protein
MFETVLIRRHLDGTNLVDAGTIAEALLFYNRVHIVADSPLFTHILQAIGSRNLLRLLEMNRIMLTYVRGSALVLTNTLPSGMQFHNFGIGEFAPAKNKRLPNSEAIERDVRTVLGPSKESKKITKSLLDYISFRRIEEVPSLAREDLSDGGFVRKCVGHILRTLVPNFIVQSELIFDVVFAGDGSFVVGSNLEFERLNEQYHRIIPPEHSSLSPAYLLSFILNARLDAYLAANYMAEIVTSPIASGIIEEKFRELVTRRHKSAADIELFQEQHLDDARAIREAINSGERTFEEFLEILEKAERFKEWIGTRNPDESLIKEYFKEVTAESWVDKLPSKSFRFVLTTLTGLGADLVFPTGGIGTMIGAGVGGIDSLLLDKLLKGWKPNQFVQGPLREFTSRADK